MRIQHRTVVRFVQLHRFIFSQKTISLARLAAALQVPALIIKTKDPRLRIRVILLSSLLVMCAAVQAQSLTSTSVAANVDKRFQIVHLDAKPDIDGVLDEALWEQATLVTDLHQISPVEYGEPSQRTEIRLFYSEDALYIGARMLDTGKVTAQTLKQGSSIFADDYFGFSIDPYHDQRNGYLFSMNPNGVRFDALFKNITDFESNWDGIWQGEGQVDAQGWTAEIVLPFQTLSFNPQTTSWGFNFERWIARNSEWIGWVTRERQMNPSINGTATGFEGLEQGAGLDIVPSVIARQERRFAVTPGSTASVEPSVDVFYKLTPQLNASLTVNTDFSAAEADTRQVNLSRFSLFFPEKRDFFLRDADIFDFGRLGTNGRPFFSRRIGLNRFGSPVDIDYGGKLSGRVGRFNVGSLFIRQDADMAGGVAAQDIFVGRATANVLAESTVGFILTDGDPQSNLDNSVYGTDFSYRNSRLPQGKIVEANVWLQQSDTQGVSGDDAAYGVTVSAPNATAWRGTASYKKIEANFDPALGFVNRPGIEDYVLDGGYMWRFDNTGPLRSVLTRLDYYRADTLDDGQLGSEATTFRVSLENQTGDNSQLRFINNAEVLRAPFTIFRSSDALRTVVIPQGTYRFNEAALQFNTNGFRKVSGGMTLRGGDYYNGSHVNGQFSLNWIPTNHLVTSLSWNEDRISLPGGDFVVRLLGVTADLVFSSHLSWSNLLQYDNVSEIVGLNSRLHWQPRAGQDAYLVFNYGLEDRDRDNDFASLNTDLSLKFSYTLRY